MDGYHEKSYSKTDSCRIHRPYSGAALSIHYRGGISRGTNLLWEINGTEVDIQVTSDMGHAQLVQLAVRGACGEEAELVPLMPLRSVFL